MNANLLWSFVLSTIGVFGIYLAGSKNVWGWFLGLGAQVLWFIFAIVTKQYGFIISAFAYGWVYGRNFLKWRREREEPDDVRD